MNNHYIPCLLLRQFATQGKINTYDFQKASFCTKKLKNTFAEKDLFDSELEKAFALKLEGPIGDLINHKLLAGDSIFINRGENLLLRKFLMINFLRAPIIDTTWKEMVLRTKLQDHPSVLLKEFLCRHHPELKEEFDKFMPSHETFIPNLKTAMEMESLEDILNPKNEAKVSETLRMAAQLSMIKTIAFWDSTDTGQEFILPKLPGISQMDQRGIFYKSTIIRNLKTRREKEIGEDELKQELDRLEYGSIIYSENFSIYPISPTRILICFSPYFRAFFPFMDIVGAKEIHPPLLDKEQFNRHFFRPMRMELFEPCKNLFNQFYGYTVKKLTAEEVMSLNALMLNMETEEFVFHDYNKIRDSFWYYDKIEKFAFTRQHNFSHMG